MRPYPKYVFYFSEKYRKLAKGSVHLHNGMLYDFGIDPEYFGNESALNELINQVDRNFDLIMIVERLYLKNKIGLKMKKKLSLLQCYCISCCPWS